LPPSSRRQAALVRAAFNCSNLLVHQQKNTPKGGVWDVDLRRFVSNGVAAVQPAASGARPRRI